MGRTNLVAAARFAAAVASLSAGAAGPAGAATVLEVERNDTLALAQNIDGHFSLEADPDIGPALHATPHVTIVANGRNDAGDPGQFPNGFTYDVFRFTVTTPGSIGYFDVDYAAPFGFNGVLNLFDGAGASIATNDNAAPAGNVEGGGSISNLDPFLTYVFATAGTYYIRVGACCEQPLSQGDYELQVTLQNHVVGLVPEPAAWALMLAGFGGAGLALRAERRRRVVAPRP